MRMCLYNASIACPPPPPNRSAPRRFLLPTPYPLPRPFLLPTPPFQPSRNLRRRSLKHRHFQADIRRQETTSVYIKPNKAPKHVISKDIIDDILDSITNNSHPPTSESKNNTSVRSLDDPNISDELGNNLN